MNYPVADAISSVDRKRYLRTEKDLIAAHHKFLWDENDSAANSLETKLAKEYHDQLFKEYCIGNLTNYKTNQIALRWRTKKEVISGKGESICGNVSCNVTEDLKSWEVNFKYVEHGKPNNALVKLRLCKECSVKLNYTKNKQKSHKKDYQVKTKPKSQSESDNEKSKTNNTVETTEDKPKDDNDLWSSKVSESSDMTTDQRMEAYLLDLF